MRTNIHRSHRTVTHTCAAQHAFPAAAAAATAVLVPRIVRVHASCSHAQLTCADQHGVFSAALMLLRPRLGIRVLPARLLHHDRVLRARKLHVDCVHVGARHLASVAVHREAKVDGVDDVEQQAHKEGQHEPRQEEADGGDEPGVHGAVFERRPRGARGEEHARGPRARQHKRAHLQDHGREPPHPKRVEEGALQQRRHAARRRPERLAGDGDAHRRELGHHLHEREQELHQHKQAVQQHILLRLLPQLLQRRSHQVDDGQHQRTKAK
mmetsp:Transcript_40215/g.119886  ORF Transcript_40215/g.119886 Transcript_40215/m.119886 type:complete len:268 (-) Transcript_40215:498-1301(-)